MNKLWHPDVAEVRNDPMFRIGTAQSYFEWFLANHTAGFEFEAPPLEVKEACRLWLHAMVNEMTDAERSACCERIDGLLAPWSIITEGRAH